MKRLLRYIAIGLLSIIVILAIFLLFLQSSPGKSILLDKALSQANKQINGSIVAEKLTGSFIRDIGLDNVSLKIENKPSVTVEKVRIEYDLFKLLSKRVKLSKILLKNTTILLEQDEKGKWNFEKLQKEKVVANSSQDTSKNEFDWDLICDALRIENANIIIETPVDTAALIPEKISNINLKLAGSLIDGKIRTKLSDSNLETIAPDFKIRTLETDVHYDSTELASKLVLETSQNAVTTDLEITDLNNPFIELLLKTDKISFLEFQSLFPELNIYGDPQIDLNVSGPLDKLDVGIGVVFEQGQIAFDAKLNLMSEPYEYNLKGEIDRLNLEKITNDTSLNSDLNLHIEVVGKGISPEEMTAQLSAQFDSSRFDYFKISPSLISVKVDPDSISTNLRVDVLGSSLQATAQYIPKSGEFKLNANIENLNLNEYSPDSTVHSDLNFAIVAEGAGTDLESISSEVRLQMLPSTINGLQLDSAGVQLHISEDLYDLYDLEIKSVLGTFRGQGEISASHVDALKITADFSDFSALTNVMPVDSLFGSGKIEASVHGPFDSLFVDTNILLKKVGVSKELNLNRLTALIDGYITKTGFDFEIVSRYDSLFFNKNLVDLTTIDLNVKSDKVLFDIDLQTATGINFETDGTVIYDTLQIETQIDHFLFEYQKHSWSKADKPAVVRIDSNSYRVEDFVVEHGQQAINLEGIIHKQTENQFTFSMKDIDISRYREFFGEKIQLFGFVDFRLALTGTLANPILDGEFVFKEGRYTEVTFDKLHADLEYKNGYFRWKCDLSKDSDNNPLESSGYLPMHLTLSPFKSEFISQDSLEIKLSTRGLDISFLKPFAPGVENLGGLLVADVVFSNTLDDIHGIGPIRLINGKMDIPEMGTKYRNFNILVVVKERQLLLQDFYIESGNGHIKLLEGSLSMTDDGVDKFNTRLKAKNFQLSNNKQMRGRASGILELSGTINEPYIYGDLKIDDAEVYYNSFEEETMVTLSSQPFFVVLQDSARFDTSGALRFQKTSDVEEKLITETNFYKNLTGELNFFFPRNVWIKSADANIEIRGDVIALKETEDFVLFGTVNTVRGFYDLLGNRFQIDEGEITFNGEPDFDPALSIQVGTTVMEKTDDDAKEYEIQVNVGGTLLAQEFEFLLSEDGGDLKQGALKDISSLLVWGTTFENAPVFGGEANQSSSTNGGLGSQATGLLTGQLMSQLTTRLGQSLKLDVIEIEGGIENTEESTIKVGKYWTPEVFVSVSQDFGENNQLVEVEYELPKELLFFNLFLQASRDRTGTTGMDFILKTDW